MCMNREIQWKPYMGKTHSKKRPEEKQKRTRKLFVKSD